MAVFPKNRLPSPNPHFHPIDSRMPGHSRLPATVVMPQPP